MKPVVAPSGERNAKMLQKLVETFALLHALLCFVSFLNVVFWVKTKLKAF